MNRWLFWWRGLRRQMWVRASLYAAAGVAAALMAVFAAPWVPREAAERLGGQGVEAILTILASSLLGVATFSVGAMVSAYTAVSQAATPRVAALVTSDREVQEALATFVGAFLYAIVAVTAVNAHYYGQEGRAILFLFSLGVVGLVAFRLLAWINRLSSLARVGHMIDLAEAQAHAALMERARSPSLGGRPGHIEAAFTIGGQRSFDQDPRFGLIVLGEIAAKALSPGVNDPGTAIQVMGAAVRVLDAWAAVPPNDADEVIYRRLWAPRIEAEHLVADVFGPPARYGAGDVAVAVRLQKLLVKLARDDGPLGVAADRQAAEALERSRLALSLPSDVESVERAAKPD